MERIIMHIDVNNAFLSWTAIYLLNNGYKYDIRNSYAVIGGDETSRRGIVLAKSMPAKKLGIVTGETLYSARKKCKVLKSYPAQHEFYKKMSNKMFELLSKYTSDIEIASIDECYLDYSKVKRLYGGEYEFAKKIQNEIFETLGFTVNIGIANNKLCAKMASDFSKPNKIHTLYDSEIKTKMWPLDVGDLFGIGKQTKIKLKELKIYTIGDLANSQTSYLYKYFKNQAQGMIDSANGINNSPVISIPPAAKGIGNEITLDHDVYNKEELYDKLLYLSEKVGIRLRKLNKYAYVVVVVLKDMYFKRYSHQIKLVNPTNITNEIYRLSIKILNEMWKDVPIRLIGIRLDNLTDSFNYQGSIFENLNIRDEAVKLDRTIDDLKEKYGIDIVKKASQNIDEG
ncbi:MAG: DNA polymerase IV [Clostridium sp.]|nr:DNA polymerase IV [Clostridium sp.]MCM1444434.1 DNA polymerase IV [Candidatus Amulumruptor caecigallinarius]